MLTILFLEKDILQPSLFHLQLIRHCPTMSDEVSQNINKSNLTYSLLMPTTTFLVSISIDCSNMPQEWNHYIEKLYGMVLFHQFMITYQLHCKISH